MNLDCMKVILQNESIVMWRVVWTGRLERRVNEGKMGFFLKVIMFKQTKFKGNFKTPTFLGENRGYWTCFKYNQRGLLIATAYYPLSVAL